MAAEAVDDTKDRRVDGLSSSSEFTLECRLPSRGIRLERETAAGPVWNANEAAGKSSNRRGVLTMIELVDSILCSSISCENIDGKDQSLNSLEDDVIAPKRGDRGSS